jgi:hypothetical protein
MGSEEIIKIAVTAIISSFAVHLLKEYVLDKNKGKIKELIDRISILETHRTEDRDKITRLEERNKQLEQALGSTNVQISIEIKSIRELINIRYEQLDAMNSVKGRLEELKNLFKQG